LELRTIRRGRARRANGRDGLLHPGDTIGCGWMREGPVRHPAAGAGGFVQPAERIEQAGHSVWIPASRRRVGRTKSIGLELVVSSELQKEKAESRARQALQRLGAWDQHAEYA